jgi:SagB-type dehydrogenase family enzyme
LRVRRTKKRRDTPPSVCARLNCDVTLKTSANGKIVACFDRYSLALGTFTAGAEDRAQKLHAGLPLRSFAGGGKIAKEIGLLVRQLARHGLLEYGVVCSSNGKDLVVIEPQMGDYWPRTLPLGNADVLVLSRFAYMRRRGTEMVLESPRAGALFRICDPKLAAALALLSTPQPVKALSRQDAFPGRELLALLVDCHILFKVGAAAGSGLRPAEGDENLVLWDFHDLVFHTRSTAGRHANPLGGVFPYAGGIPPLLAVRPRWPGKKIDLRKFAAASSAMPRVAKLLRERHSTRNFDDQQPITLTKLSRLLDGTARVLSSFKSRLDLAGERSPLVSYAVRPYPSAGGSFELELYLAANECEGLPRGFYHYDAGAHALVPIGVAANEFEALLTGATYAMGASAAPQILLTIAARFGRVSWKYSSTAYALILKDAGVLTQTLYLMATDLGLGGCAIGPTNIDLFAKMTGIDFHVEGPVGHFALGREGKSKVSDERR